MAKLLFADDQDVMREALTDLLRRQKGFDVFEARSHDDALRVVAENGPFDLILLDYTLPGPIGLGGLKIMRAACDCPVAILSGSAPPKVARQALEAGAAGFLPKTLSSKDVVAALWLMLNGEIFVPQAFLETDDMGEEVQLTPREFDVLRGVAAGKLNKEIARDLKIEEVTVKLHVKTLSRKLSAKNRTHAAMRARDIGLV